MRGGIRKYDRGCELGKPLPTQYFSSINRLVAIVAAVIGIQTVARQLIGQGDIYMGRKAKKFTKSSPICMSALELFAKCPQEGIAYWPFSAETRQLASLSPLNGLLRISIAPL